MRLFYTVFLIIGIFSSLPPTFLAIYDAELISGALYTALVVGSDTGSTVIAGSIAAGASLIGVSVSSLSASGPNRKVVIEIINHMNTSIHGGHHFLQWGWNTGPPPSVIKPMTREVVMFEKVGHTATGTAGVLVYSIGSRKDPARIAIAFSIPFNYIHASNWVGLKFISGTDHVNKQLYLDMYSSVAWMNPKNKEKYGYAYEGIPLAVYNKDYIVAASMSNLGRSIIKVDVMKLPGGQEHNEYIFRAYK